MNTLYSVRTPRSLEDSEYYVVAESIHQAARIYTDAVVAEQISVDPDELDEAGEVYVDRIGETGKAPGDPRVIDWSGDEMIVRRMKPFEKTTVNIDLEPVDAPTT